MSDHTAKIMTNRDGRLTRREFGLATLAVAAAGCAEKSPPSRIDLAVYGDCRQFAKIHRRIAGSIAARNPAAVVVAGDLVNHPEKLFQWDTFRNITRTYSEKSPMLPVIGNHDVHPDRIFEREMKLEKTWYDRKIGDFHLFVLDSIGVFRDREQIDWLRRTAEASTAKHKFAAFHHPPFLIDRKRMSETPHILANLHPVLVGLKFCAAFCGHQHAFYYTRRDGIPYVVTGGGGSALGELDTSLQVQGDLSRSFYHFVGLTVAGPKIEGRVYDPDGDEVPELAFPLCSHA
jgi:3',5'-cyclic AMP phosphodiesterase CpdA